MTNHAVTGQGPLDALGRRVEVGDRVAYPVRIGAAMHLRVGTVLDVGMRQSAAGWHKGDVAYAHLRLKDGRDMLYMNFPKAVIVR